MKSSTFLPLTLLCATLACAQANPSSQAPSLASPTAGSQLKVRGPEAVTQQDPNRVVATIDGKQITAKQAMDLLKALPPEQRQRMEKNLPQVVQQIYMIGQLADQAAKQHLDDQSPLKEQLQFARNEILAQAFLKNLANNTGAPTQDPKQYYDGHLSEFDQVKLSGILVAFNPPGTPASAGSNNSRTEAAAREKADDVEKKLKAGSDFSTLARTESDNQQVAAKGGDLGTYSIGDPNLPPDMKTALGKLQPGQVSEPIRLPNAFLIVKIDSRSTVPFDQARAGIVQRLQTEKNQAAVKQEMDKYKIQVTDPAFFDASSAPAPNVPTLQKPGSSTGQSGASGPKPQGQR
ncbi:MAG: peptidylprolyl isomerase [Acidobacteriaceae bacterium]|nr:peptidylprolyl isomerase [Acidobacteriaceae bacterium]